MSAITHQSISGYTAYNPATLVEEIAPSVFFARFKNATAITTEEIEFINEAHESIMSVEMDDCITLFAIEKKVNGISKVIGYHISSGTDFEEMEAAFNDTVEIKNKLNYEIYLIGGNDASTASGDLLDTIHEAIPKIFKKHQILGEYLNLKPQGMFVSAAMQINGVLTFCKHERLD